MEYHPVIKKHKTSKFSDSTIEEVKKLRRKIEDRLRKDLLFLNKVALLFEKV